VPFGDSSEALGGRQLLEVEKLLNPVGLWLISTKKCSKIRVSKRMRSFIENF